MFAGLIKSAPGSARLINRSMPPQHTGMPDLHTQAQWLEGSGILPLPRATMAKYLNVHNLLKEQIAKELLEMGHPGHNLQYSIEKHYPNLLAHMGKLDVGYDLPSRIRHAVTNLKQDFFPPGPQGGPDIWDKISGDIKKEPASYQQFKDLAGERGIPDKLAEGGLMHGAEQGVGKPTMGMTPQTFGSFKKKLANESQL